MFADYFVTNGAFGDSRVKKSSMTWKYLFRLVSLVWHSANGPLGLPLRLLEHGHMRAVVQLDPLNLTDILKPRDDRKWLHCIVRRANEQHRTCDVVELVDNRPSYQIPHQVIGRGADPITSSG